MASTEELRVTFDQFKKANERLKEAIELKEESEIKRDAVIQRFEFTFELLWKLFKKTARLEKIECFSPKTAFRAAFQLGFIDNEKLFVEIIDARNNTSHVYSEEDARVIYEFIKKEVLNAFTKCQNRLEQYLT